MSLDNIQLPLVAIQGLFKKSLVELKSSVAAAQISTPSTLNILGKNLRRTIVLVNNTEAAFLQDDELNFLLGILSACKLNMDDVGILNIAKNTTADYNMIAAELNAEKIFLFGIETSDIKLPLSFPNYQVQHYNNQIYLSAPPLSNLQHDKAEKTKLWNCLKQIFSI